MHARFLRPLSGDEAQAYYDDMLAAGAMLGVRRESITAAAGKLQDEGLIQYRRGNITVLNRQGLEDYAGECYKVARGRRCCAV